MTDVEIEPLTEQMRAATRTAHDISNNLVNLKLVVALTNRKVYGQSLLLFYYVFAQIEHSMEAQKDNAQLKEVLATFKPVMRGDAIVKDLNFYLGPDWSTKYKAPPAVEAYVKRIQEVEKTEPVLLIVYTYHMYTALLAGGQIIRKMVKRSFSLPDETGLQAYNFGKSKTAVRDPFKAAINAVQVDAETKQRLMTESLRVFKMNNDVVRGIEGAFRQLVLWLSKWAIVVMLIYWTYHLFIKGK